ncbi:P-loop NTPase family protein [Bacillus cereus]|uniref:AAA family ATPase n=1 Tax=Bacillus cereus TaxID=1396 RepID=UPI002ABEE7CE|nr:AAA family ATPase [Bacillus cereus]MDZ4481530.1 hypothetical protein [Bacillus cereus]MDZ4497372.1 hypothetical protein [Bacillus cereus]MDZ4519248.1 hypothetical protein [Bacillus cereus]MDZ4583432.1 hypothetical protein [Bacillus cereus]
MVNKSTRTIGEKIIIIGSPGSGKSTFSKALSKATNIPLIHLDDLYWNVDWIPTPEDEWINTIEKLAVKKRYILDGNYVDSLNIRLECADTVIFLDTPLIVCLFRIVKRTLKNRYGKEVSLPKRIREAHGIKKQKVSEGLLGFCLYVAKFHLFTKPNIKTKLEQDKYCHKVFFIKGKREIDHFWKLGGIT